MKFHIHYLSALIALSSSLSGTAGLAKLGEDISAYKAKASRVYTSKGQSTKDNKTSYLFSINLGPELKKVDPDFGGGLNITADNKGKIIGQSMALRLGKNLQVGRTLAVRFAVDFSYESLGRSVPKDRKQVMAEVDSFNLAIGNALDGKPQVVRYPKVLGKITISKQSDDSLVFATTPN